MPKFLDDIIVSSGGHIVPSADNTVDIGNTSSLDFRTLYIREIDIHNQRFRLDYSGTIARLQDHSSVGDGFQFLHLGTEILRLGNGASTTATFAGDIYTKNLKLGNGSTDSSIQLDGDFGGGDLTIQNLGNDKDILFKGNDNGSTITALTLDMSDGGWATFNSGIAVANTFSPSTFGKATFAGDVTTSGNIILSGASNEIIKSNGSIRLNIDSDANQSDRIFIVSTGANSELFRVDESGNGTFAGEVEAGSLDINGAADINGNLDTHGVVRLHYGDFILEESDNDEINCRINSNGTEGVIRLNNGANWGLVARGKANNPRLGAYHNGSLDIYGFGDSAGADHANDDLLAQFNFAGEKFLVNGEIEGASLDINGNADISGTLNVSGETTITNGNSGSAKALIVGGTGNNTLQARHIEGKLHNSAAYDTLYLNYYSNNPVYFGGHAYIEATNRLYLDGGSNSYIHQSASDVIDVVTGGSTRLTVNSNGISSSLSVYSGGSGDFRNYSGTWRGTTGQTGNGFEFINSADGTALTISSTGNAVFAGNVYADGGFLTGQTSQYSPTGGGDTLATFTGSGNDRQDIVVSNQTNHADAGAAVVLATHGHDFIIEGQSSAGGSNITFHRAAALMATIGMSQATFAGELEAASLDINGNADISGIITSSVNSTTGRIRGGGAGQLHLGDDSDIISIGRTNELWTFADVDSDQTLYVNYRGYNNGSSRFRSLDIRDGKAGSIALFRGSDKKTIFAGDIQAVNAVFTGNLTVNGTTTTVNQTNLDVSDNIIGLNRGASSNANDSGIIIERGSTGNNACILWDESISEFIFGETTATPSSTGNISLSAFRGVKAGTGTFAGAISSGAITSTGVIKSNRAEAMFELASTHNRKTTLNQGGGNFHIQTDHGSGVGINYGNTTHPGLFKLYNNTTAKVTLNANSGTGDFDGNVSHTGLTMTSGTDVDQLTTVSMTFQLAANTWTDTGIDGTDLATGTYAMQVYVDDHYAGGGHFDEYYSATISWYGGTTNSTNHDEIVLHRAGHASNASHLQIRTLRAVNSDSHDLMLQVKQNFAHSLALNGTDGKRMIFKFRRLI